ncbi:hypothetical protein TNCV_4111921 [Trichonephila clavipes]|nr:hypothetical protein TNCV_4111921 [Trichonephila clavipes]
MSVPHDHSQTVDRAKVRLVLTVTTHCQSRLPTVEPDYIGAWLDKVGIMLTGDVECLATNPASNCVLTIIEDLSGDV